jgi:hypothetical protein
MLDICDAGLIVLPSIDLKGGKGMEEKKRGEERKKEG